MPIQRYYTILLAAIWSFVPVAVCANINTIQYQISYSDLNKSSLDIALQSTIDSNGEYLLQFPMGATSLNIENLNKTITIYNTDNPFIKKFKGQPGETIQLRYSFCLPNPQKSIEWPILEENYFVFKLGNVLAMPNHNITKNWKIKIDTNPLPEEYAVYSNFSQNIRNILLDTSIPKLSNSMLVAGSFQPKEISINKKSVYFIGLGEINSLSQKPVHYLKNLVKAQRDFWQDNDFENYLIVLNERPCNDAPAGASGIHLQNSILLQLTNCGENLDYRNVYGMSHELSHAWIGNKITLEVPHLDFQWFVEGFNDFFGLNLALKSGAMSQHDFVELYNQLICFYYILPINHISNDQIAKNYFRDPFYHQLAQLRGHLFARTLSIQLKDDQTSSLKSIVKDVYQDQKVNKLEFVTRQNVDKVFHRHLNKKLWKNYIDQMYNGDPLKLSDTDLQGAIKLSEKLVEVPDLGFNLKILIETQTIAELDLNSPAFNAGLRNGQKVRGHNLSLINTERRMSIWIEEDEKIKEVAFYPNRKKSIVPQYEFTKRFTSKIDRLNS